MILVVAARPLPAPGVVLHLLGHAPRRSLRGRRARRSSAPVVAVALGAAVLHEKVPASAAAVTAYAACLLSVLAATIWLARAWSGPENHPAQ